MCCCNFSFGDHNNNTDLLYCASCVVGCPATLSMALVDVMEVICCEPYSASTDDKVFHSVLNSLAKLGRHLFAIFNHPARGSVRKTKCLYACWRVCLFVAVVVDGVVVAAAVTRTASLAIVYLSISLPLFASARWKRLHSSCVPSQSKARKRRRPCVMRRYVMARC